ncbi:LytR/AlgR family response regulator transcription factor [Marinicrinis sediminis]|uniref:LytR/AlgR family response regulator transcription factor n=1 Tax=Marinicrinis sediminis TaxID=1652465 RepID=A0ABW5R7T4_9BACL
MDEMKVIIAEDHESSRHILCRLLEPIPYLTLAGQAEDGEELVQLVKLKDPQLVIVDISMPKLSGLEAIKQCVEIAPHLKVVFITAHDDYALQAFDVSAVDYIVKPYQKDRLYQAVEKSRQLLNVQQEPRQGRTSSPHSKTNRLVFRSGTTTHFIPVADLIFVEKHNRKCILHTISGMYEINDTLGALTNRLDNRFIQSHRSYLINLEYIYTIQSAGDTHLVYFRQYDQSAYISKSKLNEVLDMLENQA